jgi:putative transposase
MARKAKTTIHDLIAEDMDLLRDMLQELVQQALEAEMTELLGATKGERSPDRQGYRSGYYSRGLVTRVGRLELRVPQDRAGRFSTELFERYRRSEKAQVSAPMEMYVQGVSIRKVKAVTEQLCGSSFSASTIRRINKRLDGRLRAFHEHRLTEGYPYLIVDARYEKAREDNVVRSRAVLVALGIGWDGRRCVLGVYLANREIATSWRDFLASLKQRGLAGVELVVSDAHEGLRQAIVETLPEAVWQHCYVHFSPNTLDHLPCKADENRLTKLRGIYKCRDIAEARRELATLPETWGATATPNSATGSRATSSNR